MLLIWPILIILVIIYYVLLSIFWYKKMWGSPKSSDKENGKENLETTTNGELRQTAYLLSDEELTKTTFRKNPPPQFFKYKPTDGTFTNIQKTMGREGMVSRNFYGQIQIGKDEVDGFGEGNANTFKPKYNAKWNVFGKKTSVLKNPPAWI